MKHKTWFRLVIKAIGIYLICQSIPNVISQASAIILQVNQFYLYSQPGWTLGQQMAWIVPQALQWVVSIAVGLYLVFGGSWIVNMCIPSNRPYCPECGYDLSKSSGANCPECGVALPASAPREG